MNSAQSLTVKWERETGWRSWIHLTCDDREESTMTACGITIPRNGAVTLMFSRDDSPDCLRCRALQEVSANE